MREEINTALVVLGVGMITVFIILGLVVLTGHLLINLVNRYFPEASIKSPLKSYGNINQNPLPSQNDKSTIAAIITAVDIITEGKGKAVNIEKVNRS